MKKSGRRRFYVFILIAVVLISLGFIRFGTFKHQQAGQPVNLAKTSIAAEAEPAPVTANRIQPVLAQQAIADPAKDISPKVYYQNKVAVLTYHHLDAAESSVTITPERFAGHLKTLKSNGFHVISMEDFVAFMQKKKNVPANAVVITFDDGYESVYKYGYPLLKAEGMPATVFLIVSYIEDGAVHMPSILNWPEINQMHNNGLSFYSHTYNAHDSVYVKGQEYSLLTVKTSRHGSKQETEAEYQARVRSDLAKADDILNAKLANKVNLLCLPHGAYNQTVLDAASQLHIPYIFTGVEGLNTEQGKLINRINAGSPYMTDQLLIKKLGMGSDHPNSEKHR